MDLLTAILARNQRGEPLARIETTTSVLIKESSIPFTDGMVGGGITDIELAKALDDLRIHEGYTYTVKWDGIEYTCETKKVVQDGTAFDCIGNMSAFGETDTGEPFAFIGAPTETIIADFSTSEGGTATHTVFISEHKEVIHPLPDWAIPQIPASKLPGAVLPVVEITTTIKKGAVLTEEESTILTELCADLVPLVINCTIESDGTLFRGGTVFNPMVADFDGTSATLLSCSLNGLFISLVSVSGANWQCELGQAQTEG